MLSILNRKAAQAENKPAQETAKKAAALLTAAALAAAGIHAAYNAGRDAGRAERLAGFRALCPDGWAWYADTENGPAYTLDKRVGYDGTVLLEDMETGTQYVVPLLIW